MSAHLDLDFIRHAAYAEGLPVVAHYQVPRADVLIDRQRGCLWVHPMMRHELRFHGRPSEWLDAIRDDITSKAKAAAGLAIAKLDADGAEDRALIAQAEAGELVFEESQLFRDLLYAGEFRLCPHGFHHPPWAHSCDGCWCEGERDRRDYGWPHDTSPRPVRSSHEPPHRRPA